MHEQETVLSQLRGAARSEALKLFTQVQGQLPYHSRDWEHVREIAFYLFSGEIPERCKPVKAAA